MKYSFHASLATLLLLSTLAGPGAVADEAIVIAALGSGATLRAVPLDKARWGLRIDGAAMASAVQDKPVYLEFWSESGEVDSLGAAYQHCERTPQGWLGKAAVSGPGGARFEVDDAWRQDGDVLRLARTVRVAGRGPGGFLSGIAFDFTKATCWRDADWFAPGMIYGGFAHLSEAAIGGSKYYRAGAFAGAHPRRPPAGAAGGRALRRRRVAGRARSRRPRRHHRRRRPGHRGRALIDRRFRFGAVGGEERQGKLSVGFWYPGSEGEVTYAGNTYPGGQLHKWRRRYHPIQDGLVDRFEVAFRIGRNEDYVACRTAAWRWAWETLKPKAIELDIPAARRCLVDVLARNVVEKEGRAGIPTFVDAVSHDLARADRKAIMGFCGKNLEAANFLLQEAALDESLRGQRLRRQGEAIIASFLRLKVSPPAGEGFDLVDGSPRFAIGDREVFLRSFGDDIKALLKAYQRERSLGRNHPQWLAWCRQFADWLLGQQQPSGGFPRSWTPGEGRVVSASPNATFNAVPLLVMLHRITGQASYLAAARRAADFSWTNGQCRGCFVGGTIDNPDVLDKEAGASRWRPTWPSTRRLARRNGVDRAAAAANFAETWIYCWNVPMAADEDDARLHWKRGVSTVGLQLIATGHSLVDAYMAFDADQYARLYRYTGDRHDLEVARILLYNTKGMLAMPDRPYDLGSPGWQQEHWSLASRRGYGLHRGWLPWVATSQLKGIFGVMDLDAQTRREVMGAERRLLPSPPPASSAAAAPNG